MENLYINSNETKIDLDCLSLIKVADKIRKKHILKADEIENIFSNILPSTKKPQLDDPKIQTVFKIFQRL